MSTPPSIPPRPARAQNSSAATSTTYMDVPQIPPRPKRSIERSVSPNRDTFARSPLNDPSYAHNGPPKDHSRLSTDVPPRPPSVSLPTLGQEGSEYASFEDLSKTLTSESHGSVQQSAVASDLPLHAPTASVPGSSRIQGVTRTDSSQAAAAGFGKQLAPDDKASQGTKSGRSGSSIGSRPASIYNDKDHQGIPEIGVQVPMFRNAGDVQAPTPSPYEQQGGSAGSGFHNKPGGRHHGRTKSGREIFHGPPGSYGMHGHGKISNDEFEQKWYEKHPDDLKREKAGEYGPHIQENRKDYHWRADDLEKIVHGPSRDIGMGTSRDATSTPDEQIGYRATEEYASRMASPKPTSSARPTNKSGNMESGLRQETRPDDAHDQVDDNGDVIHIDPPAHRGSKIHGGGYDPPTEDLGPDGGNTDGKGGWVTEQGYGTPILASDELKKHPDAEWRQPAVSPELERRHDDEYTINEDGTPAYVTKARTHSRSSSRNNTPAQRAVPSPAQFDRSGTPLESHKEYEPLFPEEEDEAKPKTQADKIKRPHLARHHFPSQDVWEDTPGSLQLETTVETPQAPEEPETPSGPDVNAAQVFENPEMEEKRKETITQEDQESFLSEHTKQFAVENKHLRGVRGERPSVQRFPSQDIWEDAPDHGYLETTVSEPQSEDTNEYAPESPIVEKPSVPGRPVVPTRPQKEISPVDKKAPAIPDRPKPQVPARPSRPSTTSSEKIATAEPRSENDTPQLKAKPPVPARPSGSKIAALQAGFLKDLNSKLGLGPQAPKIKEPEETKEEAEPAQAQPLPDARKGRAKGPQRRKPTASPSPAPAPAATVTAEVAVPKIKLEMAPVTALWSFGEDGILSVPAAEIAAKLHQTLAAPEKEVSPPPAQAVDEIIGEAADEAKVDAEVGLDSEMKAETGVKRNSETEVNTEAAARKAVAEGSDPVSGGPGQELEGGEGAVDVPGAFPDGEATSGEQGNEEQDKDTGNETALDKVGEAGQTEAPKQEKEGSVNASNDGESEAGARMKEEGATA